MKTSQRRFRRPDMPEDVPFPVTPMLDMSFQLLAFFILTFQTPTLETRLDLYLPATSAALPGASAGPARPMPERRVDPDLDTDLMVKIVGDDSGSMKSLKLGEADVPSVELLGERIKQYRSLLQGRPLRILLVADDRLRYEEGARVMGVCSSAGVDSLRLADPSTSTTKAPPAIQP